LKRVSQVVTYSTLFTFPPQNEYTTKKRIYLQDEKWKHVIKVKIRGEIRNIKGFFLVTHAKKILE
jgi:hypothetical protein